MRVELTEGWVSLIHRRGMSVGQGPSPPAQSHLSSTSAGRDPADQQVQPHQMLGIYPTLL